MSYDDLDSDAPRDRSRARSDRFIDWTLPLPWILASAAAICITLGGMYFELRAVSKDVSDLKLDVKAGNNQQVTVQGELALLRFRVENLESEKRSAR